MQEVGQQGVLDLWQVVMPCSPLLAFLGLLQGCILPAEQLCLRVRPLTYRLIIITLCMELLCIKSISQCWAHRHAYTTPNWPPQAAFVLSTCSSLWLNASSPILDKSELTEILPAVPLPQVKALDYPLLLNGLCRWGSANRRQGHVMLWF